MDKTIRAGYYTTNTFWEQPDGEFRKYENSGKYHAFLRKPDKPIINQPEQDGFRKPSGYYMRLISNYGENQFPVLFDLSGGGVNPDFPGRHTISGTQTGPLSTGSLPDSGNNVRMKLLNNVRNEVFDVAMVLAEISKTADTLSNNLLRLGRSLEQIRFRKPDSFYYLLNGKRHDKRRPTDKFLRESAGVFMEWKYGIMPTVYDIQGATKALDMNKDDSFWERPPILVARATDRTTSTGSSLIPLTMTGLLGFPSSRGYGRVDWVRKTEHKARLDYSVTGEGLRGLNRYGLGLGSIPTVLFDKTPFSFVLNMAIPIAELIKAWTALAGVTIRGYSETRYTSTEITGGTHVNVSPKGPVVIVNAKPVKPVPVFTRTAYKTVPMPMPYVRNPIKLGNIQTVLALFTQLRSSHPVKDRKP